MTTPVRAGNVLCPHSGAVCFTRLRITLTTTSYSFLTVSFCFHYDSYDFRYWEHKQWTASLWMTLTHSNFTQLFCTLISSETWQPTKPLTLTQHYGGGRGGGEWGWRQTTKPQILTLNASRLAPEHLSLPNHSHRNTMVKSAHKKSYVLTLEGNIRELSTPFKDNGWTRRLWLFYSRLNARESRLSWKRAFWCKSWVMCARWDMER